MEQQNQKIFLVLNIIAFESRTINSHTLEQDTCHWQSMYYETPLGFKISLREIFSESGSLRVMEKYYGSALMKNLQEFKTL